MATERSLFQMTPAALESLAHPVRGRVMRALAVEGAATATALAQRIGESSGLTSYHLRKLAAVGLVEEDAERGTRKERWWRPVHEGTTWSNADFLGDPAAHRASVAFRRSYYAWQAQLLEQRLATEGEWPQEWVDAASDSDDLLTLTPAEAQAMAEEIWDVVQRYRDAGARTEGERADAVRVVWLQHLVPLLGEVPL